MAGTGSLLDGVLREHIARNHEDCNSRLIDNLEAALRTAFSTPGPALVEVLVNRQELSLPPSITFAQAKGFSLWAAKSVLSGRADEIIDLAKTNLIQRILS